MIQFPTHRCPAFCLLITKPTQKAPGQPQPRSSAHDANTHAKQADHQLNDQESGYDHADDLP